MHVSIIICTRNRAENLQATLAAIGELAVPAGWNVELLVVDNASTDQTPAVVKAARLDNLTLRYLHEPKQGLSFARNAGMAASRGEIILFTDDDVRPVPDWIRKLGSPLLKDKCDAVAGSVSLAGHLRRPWLDPLHQVWLAAPALSGGRKPELVGANMGFHRSVLERVPGFDPELGPGAMGFGDDTLFSFQLDAAGFRIHEVPEAHVVHHPDTSRLQRANWLAAAQKRGRTSGYLLHHWQHVDLKNPLLRAGYVATKLHLRRRLQHPVPPDAEGCDPWEMSYLHAIEMCRQYAQERSRPRNYTWRGLVRLDRPVPADPVTTEPRSQRS